MGEKEKESEKNQECRFLVLELNLFQNFEVTGWIFVKFWMFKLHCEVNFCKWTHFQNIGSFTVYLLPTFFSLILKPYCFLSIV